MDVVFYERNGSKYVKIEDGNARFEEMISKTSLNGEYSVAAGCWYINSEDDDNDGDEIDDSAEAIIFQNEQIVYRATGIESLYDAEIQDDGRLCVWDDENAITIWSKTGTPIKKKFAFDVVGQGMYADYAWACGDGEDGNLRLSVLLFDQIRMWTKKFSADISSVNAVFMIKDNINYDQSYFIALVEDYDYKTSIIKYGIDGKKQELTQSDIVELKQIFKKR